MKQYTKKTIIVKICYTPSYNQNPNQTSRKLLTYSSPFHNTKWWHLSRISRIISETLNKHHPLRNAPKQGLAILKTIQKKVLLLWRWCYVEYSCPRTNHKVKRTQVMESGVCILALIVMNVLVIQEKSLHLSGTFYPQKWVNWTWSLTHLLALNLKCNVFL